jgi:hypothetical protein
MGRIPVHLCRLVVERAGNRCEYCGLAQEGQEARFHVDHVAPRASGGGSNQENLALACVSCSLRKAARLTAVDPQTGFDTELFNPRFQNWHEHFQWNGVRAVGLTAHGRATVEALRMNRPVVLAIREEEAARGRHPPAPRVG